MIYFRMLIEEISLIYLNKIYYLNKNDEISYFIKTKTEYEFLL